MSDKVTSTYFDLDNRGTCSLVDICQLLSFCYKRKTVILLLVSIEIQEETELPDFENMNYSRDELSILLHQVAVAKLLGYCQRLNSPEKSPTIQK